MANSLSGTLIAEKYRLGELLRSTETAELYDAVHVLMDKPVSIRVLRPSLAADKANAERFFEDARLASKISDPHVLNISDFGSDREGFVYSVHEPYAGKTLKEVISEDGAFPIHSSVEISRQIAKGLEASHAVGRIHGNLSSENVLLNGANGIAVKVLDFGTANPIDREATDSAEFAYIAPEQCAGSDKADERGDIYSLGAITYETLSGVPPYTGEKPSEVMLRHMEEMPAPLVSYRGDIPDGLEAVIVKALAKNPEIRQQTAQEFAEELSPIGEMAAASDGVPQNNLWKTAFIVLVGMTALAAFLIYGTYTKRTDPMTALQPDANGLPVQPINPATGVEEQSLAAMPALTSDTLANSNLAQPPGTLPGGDGYNPWGNGGVPPAGAPYIPPGGQVVTIDPATGSPFMPTDGGVVLVPVPVNSNTGTAKPSPTPKMPTTNANTGITLQSTPAANTAPPKGTPTPAVRPTRTPRPAPAKSPGADDKQID
ncbi:MAG: serine/threonine protein kinase [Pyrinomonadaceae bacterium]